MDALRSLVQPLIGGSSMMDGMKLVVIGGTVETARRVSSSAWTHFVNSFFLTAHFSEEDLPYDWLMLWLSRRAFFASDVRGTDSRAHSISPEWQRSREFETTTRASHAGQQATGWEEDPDLGSEFDDSANPSKTRVIFQPTFDTTHTIYWRGHWLRVRRSRGTDGCEILSVSVVARSNTILKALVLQAKRDYEAEAVHRIQIYFADPHGSWRWADARHKRPLGTIVLEPGVKEMLLGDARDFLASEKWYSDRGVPWRRGYLLHGVPGSGKSSLIHALAGELMLDIYVVSLSSAWISDSVLMGLMGRVPKGAILLLEDLDAAFTRSVQRRADADDDGKEQGPEQPAGSKRRSREKEGRERNEMSDLNTLSLSGLLNALDGVAAAEGRILFATTNHLEKLDPALSRPGRMDVWVEFRNASKWQAEALFRNFFPSAEPEDDDLATEFDEAALAEIDIPTTPSRASRRSSSTSSLWSAFGGSGSGSSASMVSLPSSMAMPSSGSSTHPSSQSTAPSSPAPKSSQEPAAEQTMPLGDLPQFGASNTAYLPPPPAPEILAAHAGLRPLDAKTLAVLAKRFADAIPEGEFSVAALQGYLLKNKSRPEAAAEEASNWVTAEREMRERLMREREAREVREKIERERRKKAAAERKAKEKAEKEKKAREEKEAKEKQEREEKEKAEASKTETTGEVQQETKTATATEPAPSDSGSESVVIVEPEAETPVVAEATKEEKKVEDEESSESESESEDEDGSQRQGAPVYVSASAQARAQGQSWGRSVPQ
ncbi:hypothetical protein HMN09_00813500 [Mycena chlorophos]|uniref:P-loop containing nucleoside triphosphate hydrolase protein n=1 Tax=Mycena chlorophos TaxID=658473 RepID=A0A8H6SUP4_MYCCL|nr:hypothetical protein HMN09_00813500 [Mycena chlorophos]